MTIHRLRPPGMYPFTYHDALRVALAREGEWVPVLGVAPDKARRTLILLRQWYKSYQVFAYQDRYMAKRLSLLQARFKQCPSEQGVLLFMRLQPHAQAALDVAAAALGDEN